MRKVLVIGLGMAVALSAVITGSILAQDDDTTQEKAWLGVRVSETDAGVAISRVESGSPAETAGLLVGT